MNEIEIAVKLKPCPFCGSDDTETDRLSSGHIHFVTCHECKTDGPTAESEYLAVGLWNKRSGDAE